MGGGGSEYDLMFPSGIGSGSFSPITVSYVDKHPGLDNISTSNMDEIEARSQHLLLLNHFMFATSYQAKAGQKQEIP